VGVARRTDRLPTMAFGSALALLQFCQQAGGPIKLV
jgi:hypothetical protein